MVLSDCAVSAIPEPPDELQGRPGRIDGDDLHVHQSQVEADVAYDVLVEVRGDAAGFLGPGDPHRTRRRQPPGKRFEPLQESPAIGSERQHDVALEVYTHKPQ